MENLHIEGLNSPPGIFNTTHCAHELEAGEYVYEGRCPQTGDRLSLPRTREVEAIARALMAEFQAGSLGERPGEGSGKMYGVLLAKDAAGDRHVLKAFSGLLDGQAEVCGWVPPMLGRDRVAQQEVETLAQLEALKQRLGVLQQMPERSQWAALAENFDQQLREMGDRHCAAKAQRQIQRQALAQGPQSEAPPCSDLLEDLDEQSRQAGIERRKLKRLRDQTLESLAKAIALADDEIRQIKRQRKSLSQQLQAQLNAAYSLTNFGGRSQSLAQLLHSGPPTGTGDCSAPKLLQAAAAQRLQPMAMAEFWWGPPLGNKVQGEFYGACTERCQPLMGFLLSGMQFGIQRGIQRGIQWGIQVSVQVGVQWAGEIEDLAVLYEDDGLLAIDKPAGLLSVPGRTSDRQDSVLSRLNRRCRPDRRLIPVHRLDQATSGILLLAKDPDSHRQLSHQFQQRQVEKEYEALVVGSVLLNAGEIQLPLWGDPSDRPRQSVNEQRGKHSLTKFRVLDRLASGGFLDLPQPLTRLALMPITGRTHQLRVHACEGLGTVILGDRLYGCQSSVDRLYLHAKVLKFTHFRTRERVDVRSHVPF